jgi:hypothetical protein
VSVVDVSVVDVSVVDVSVVDVSVVDVSIVGVDLAIKLELEPVGRTLRQAREGHRLR